MAGRRSFSTLNPGDPQDPGDLGGELPAGQDIRLKRINQTSRKIVSPAD
jgi:hypothetical protein